MTAVIIIARIVARPGSAETVKRELLKLVGPTRQESGCIDYLLHQDKVDPAQFLFYERWESAEHLQKHMQTEHFIHCKSALADKVEETALQELTRLD